MIYDEELPDYGDKIPVKDFLESCAGEFFIDYDGHGYPVKGNKMASGVVVKPSNLSVIPSDATHIMWFNR